MFVNTPEMIGYDTPSWYPTMVLNMQFFAK
jgi:hypothetical protein